MVGESKYARHGRFLRTELSMSTPKAKEPSYEEVIADLLDSTKGPVSVNELAEKLIAVRPSQAKNPLQAMRQRLRQANGRSLVFLDADTILPLRLAFQAMPVSRQVDTPLGLQAVPTLHANLSAWFRDQEVSAKDHLLITTLDWEQGVLQLEREPFGQRDQDLLAQRNRLLANLFFDLLESAVDEDIYVHVAVPTVGIPPQPLAGDRVKG